MSSAGGNIFMEYSHFFEYYVVVILETEPWQGAGSNKRHYERGEMTARVIGFESGPV